MVMGLLNAVDLMAEKIAKKRGLQQQTPQLVQPQENRMVPIVEQEPNPLLVINPGPRGVISEPGSQYSQMDMLEMVNAGRGDIIAQGTTYPQGQTTMFNAGQVSAPIYEYDTSGIPQNQPANIQREVVYPNQQPLPVEGEVQQQINSLGSNGGVIDKIQADDRFSFSSQDSLGLKRNGTVQFKGTDTGVDPVQLDKNQQKLSQGYGSQKHYENTFGNAEFMLALAMGFNNLSTFPNAQWGQFLQGQMKDISAQKKATNNANWFVSRGREDLAEAVFNGLPMEQALAEYNKKPDETFRELTAEEYKAMGHDPLLSGRIQISETTGKRSGFASKPPQTNISVNTGGTGKYAEQLGKVFAESDVELANKAVKVPQRISALNATALAITEGAASQGEEGFLTGPLAGFRQGVDRFLVAFGDRSPERINRLTDAELIDATLGADVFGAIGELGIGARGLDTPAEREFLRQVLTGTTETTPSALLYLAYLRQKIQSRTAEQYNSLFDSGAYGQMATQRGMTRIEIPESIFGEEFTSFDDAKKWLANKKKEYADKNIEGAVDPDGSGSFTDDDGTEYDIERVD